MFIWNWFTERMNDAFTQNPAYFVYLLVTITLFIILVVDMRRMKTNQINRQVSARIGKDDDEKDELQTSLIERLFAKQEEKVKNILQRANILFTPKEFISFMMTGALIGFAIGMVIYPLSSVWKSVFVAIGLGATQDLFGRLLAGAVFGVIGSYFPYIWVKHLEKKRRKLLESQIQDALLNIADALKSGHVINDSIKIVGNEMPYPMGHEFALSYKEMEAGKTLKEALRDLKHRVNIEDFTMAIDAMEIQYDVGGELEPLLRKMVGVVQERQELKQEVKKTIANAKMTGSILMVAPLGFLTLFITMSPDQYILMIQNVIGWILLIVAAVSYAIGIAIIYLIIRNITKEI